MGRVKRNITPEEKLAANRAKSKRYYEKKRDQINERRRKYYKRTRSKTHINPPLPKTTNANGEKTLIAVWMEEATRVLTAIEELTENAPTRYVERLYQQYITDKNANPLQEQVSLLGELRTSILECESEVLNKKGLGSDYNNVRSVSDDLTTLIKWVDEVYVYSYLDDAELERAHQKRELLYQSSHK